MRQVERRDALVELLPDDRDARLRILDVMAQLLRAVHRIHGHHGRVGAQDGVIGDDELRAVLEVEEYAVTLDDAAMALQEPGERIGFPLDVRVGQARAVIVDERALGVLLGAGDEIGVDALA